jgi:hypothetical protein
VSSVESHTVKVPDFGSPLVGVLQTYGRGGSNAVCCV